MTKPRLIYDGDCDFCTYSVNYWHKLTGDKVDYEPYQKVEKDYPQISRKEFQRAVQYVAPNKEIASGAKASFLTLSHAPGRKFWLWLYYYFPLFAFFSEKAYTFVSSHRNGFYWLSKVLYGSHYVPPQYNLVVGIFLRMLGLIFFSAFVSFGVQALGLIGSHGIIPVADLVQLGNNVIGNNRYWVLPMVFWVNSSDVFIQVVCWAGALLSLLVVLNVWPFVNLIILYLLYLSLVTAGQVFMTFQWDIFLLETSVLTLILLRFQATGIWLLRWLLFRFMFAAGLVKYFSGDASWQAWTALYTYFVTEPLPTPLAWYAHQVPHVLLQFATLATLIIELIIPFFIFMPRRIRFFAAFSILLLQIIISLTGNYNFFNWLTMTLCIVCFDDAALQKIIPRKLVSYLKINSPRKTHSRAAVVFVSLFIVYTVTISLVQFHMRFLHTTNEFWVKLNSVVAPLNIVGMYGPFAVITYPRNEIIIEGSMDGNEWKEYEFRYKPGDVKRRPLWNIPHQPRLDWQMWFAALSKPEQNPWFFNFLDRLLQNSPDVVKLLKTNPFPDAPPLFIRANFYDYRFTDFAQRKSSGAWWTRDLVGSYTPVVRRKTIFDRY